MVATIIVGKICDFAKKHLCNALCINLLASMVTTLCEKVNELCSCVIFHPLFAMF